MATRMRLNRRLFALVVSFLLAGLAAVSLLSYVKGVESRAAEEDENVEVLYAKEAIPAGTSAEAAAQQGLIASQPMPRRVVAQGALGTIEPLTGLVARSDIYPGEQIVLSRFAAEQDVQGFLPIPADRQAITVEVGVPPGLAGFVQAGNRIAVLAQLSVIDSEAPPPADPAADPKRIDQTQFLLQDVPVLSAGRRVILPEGGEDVQQPQDRVLLTIAVTAEEAEKLAYGIFNGSLYMTLLPDEVAPEDATADTPGRTFRNAFEGAAR